MQPKTTTKTPETLLHSAVQAVQTECRIFEALREGRSPESPVHSLVQAVQGECKVFGSGAGFSALAAPSSAGGFYP